jgi:hypothetical protein
LAAVVLVSDGWAPFRREPCFKFSFDADLICLSNSPQRRIARAWMRSAILRKAVSLACLA